MSNTDDDDLNAALAALRDTAPRPSDDFLSRLERDADAHLPPSRPLAASAPIPRSRWFPLFAGGGFALASAVGVVLGFALPETMNDLILGEGDMVYLSEMLPAADPSLTLGEDG